MKLKEQGLVIIGIKRKNGEIIFSPSKDEAILQDDRIVAIGRPENFTEIISDLTCSNYKS